MENSCKVYTSATVRGIVELRVTMSAITDNEMLLGSELSSTVTVAVPHVVGLGLESLHTHVLKVLPI